MKLIEIIDQYQLSNSDFWEGTDKQYHHFYISEFYEEKFKPLKDKNVSLLEIGFAAGASLLLWSLYFKNGKITGIDISDRVKEKYKTEKVNYLFYDAYDEKNVNKNEEFDIIIDDGSHKIEHQTIFVEYYYKKLKPQGLMIIEDIESDENINILKNKINKIFNKDPIIIDNRKKTNLANEIIIYVQK
jgi:2-polyprenyl-3-methyl-5-hydroxy-6-metoxy-1,4-benzoquinol methylase